MNLLEKNINLLNQDARHKIAPASETDINVYFAGYRQQEILFYDTAKNSYLIKNQLDKTNLPIAVKKELIIILGLAGTGEIKQIIEQTHPHSAIIIVEPNPAFVLYAMQHQDLSFLSAANICLIAHPLKKLSEILNQILSSEAILLVSNLRIYATYFYRYYHLPVYKTVVQAVGTVIRYLLFTLGNDIEDSLTGFKNNLHNIRYLPSAKDVAKLKNALPAVPAVIVAAGPSLEKNMHYLRRAKGKALIFAVDTIWQKLLKVNIVPDFVCTIERPANIYDYFYKDRSLPAETALLVPPVVTPKILANHQGLRIIPLRQGIREYRWLNDQVLHLGQDALVSMGASVAHLAFGFAAHLGASPIVLVGQDLAYGEDGARSHSAGTIYDDGAFKTVNQPKISVEGYYGGKVLTQKIWVDFKMWFESTISTQELFVINATEGGASIAGTKQMPLAEVLERYCTKKIDVAAWLNSQPEYPVSLSQIQDNLAGGQAEIESFLDTAEKTKKKLFNIKFSPNMPEKGLAKKLAVMKKMDSIISQIGEHHLIAHMLQPYMINIFNRFHKIPAELSYDNVMTNLKLQQEFMTTVCKVVEMTLNVIKKSKNDK